MKKIGKIILHIIEWIFAIFGFIIAVAMIAYGGKGIISGIVFLMSALVISPVFEKIPILTSKPKKRIILQFVSAFVIFVIAFCLVPTSSNTEKIAENNPVSDVSVTSTTTVTTITEKVTTTKQTTTKPVTTTYTTSTTTETTTTSTITSTTSTTTTATTTITTIPTTTLQTTTQPVLTTIVYTQPPVIVQENSRTVYYTETGSKYHYDGNCGRGTYYPCTLDEAIGMGLEPCKKCT